MKFAAIWIYFMALAFGIMKVMYFGWHWIPESEAELIADGIGMIMLVVGIACMGYHDEHKTKD